MVIVEEARAKVNLALHVTGRRPDGYHLLDMVAVFPAIGDRVIVEPSETPVFRVTGPMAEALADASDDNLVMRAVRGFSELSGRPARVSITLEKHLPVASGIGGGSADAAAALRALCRIEGFDGASPEILRLALSLGADVPMCLTSVPARVRGIGEDIAPLSGRGEIGLLLVNPGIGLSTPAVFKALTCRDNPPIGPAIPEDANAAIAWLAAETRNDLEPPARLLQPVIGGVIARIGSLPGVRLARMSGSGATCFGVFDTAEAAEAALSEMQSTHPDWWAAAGRARL